MNIILLSGGSGRRLWPLSSNSRSKQFLKVLRTPQGVHESMIQRVYRQLRENLGSVPVVVSTTDAQKDTIRRQLGDGVDIALEPERRDTFPAIALAAVFLACERKCARDETVLVMPVDVYAENGYFETLQKMDRAIQNGVADMVLMGIRPTYPAAKYGYIVPVAEQTSNLMRVSHFEEKPSVERAVELLDMGAFWNGGVFAFRMGYILDIVRRYMEPKSYPYIRDNYGKLRKISFDYEIVEACQSIAMVPYYGMWKDLGTWNTLCDVMEELANGKVISGQGMENTHIINELDIPIVALGIKNAVIAACPDGILVTEKWHSGLLKEYVDQIHQRPMYEMRQWGSYKVLNYTNLKDGRKSLTKQLDILPGKALSYQWHKHRDEIWTIVDGEGEVLLDGQARSFCRGDVVSVGRMVKHSLRAITAVTIIEVQIGEELTEEDIERFGWAWEDKAEP